MCGPFIVCFSWLCFNCRRRRRRSMLFHSFSFTFFVSDFCLLYEFKLSLINFVHVRSASKGQQGREGGRGVARMGKHNTQYSNYYTYATCCSSSSSNSATKSICSDRRTVGHTAYCAADHPLFSLATFVEKEWGEGKGR